MLYSKIFHPFSLFILTQIQNLAPAIAAAAPAASISSSNVGVSVGGISSLLHASIIVQLVILILVALSILCWAIGWAKYQQFALLRAANEKFDQLFWASSSLDDLFEKVEAHTESSHARVFKAAYLEMKKIAESPLTSSNRTDATVQLTGLDNLERSIRKSTDNEIASLEARLTVLATTGSTGPFIGLFGTVWGIMNSFHQIGQTGSASLAAVAPGISEALITTAIGLAAAIPAVVIYNQCIAMTRKEEISLSNFSSDFLNIVKRNFFKG